MADHYAILVCKKFHTFPQLTGIQKHHNREIELKHVNYEDSIKNTIMVDAGESYVNAWKRRIAEVETETGKPVTVRSNAVRFFELVLTFSPGAEVDVKQWAKANEEWLKENFGEENILACTLHLDEETPHIHADIIPIDDRGKLCMKSFINGPSSLIKLQNSYAKAMEPFGLVRGEKHTKTKRTTIQQFYKSVNKVEKNPFPQQLEDEDDKSYIKKLQEYTKDLTFAYQNMKMKARRTEDIIQTRIANHYKDFIDAFYLQYQIKDNLEDEELVKHRLQMYRQLEKVVPQDELNKVLNFLLDRFQEEEKLQPSETEKPTIHAFMDPTNQQSDENTL